MIQRPPGMYLSETEMFGVSTDLASAIPVFAGFVERGETLGLHEIASFAHYREIFGAGHSSSMMFHAIRHYFDNGGAPCFVLPIAVYGDIKEGAVGLAEQIAGALMPSLVKQESSLTLLSVPDIALLPDGQADCWHMVWHAMLALCEEKRDLFALLDTPEDPVVARATLDSFVSTGMDRGAAYWPRLLSNYDTADAQRVVVPCSAAVAAAIQRTDRQNGIWKAPANIALSHVVKPTQHHLRGRLLFNEASVSVNVIRSFPGNGVRIWGCRTLMKDAASPWRYVQVRRMVSHIETTLSELGRFVVFEPNNEITWLKFKGVATAWLRRLWQRGGMFGAEESDAYRFLLGRDESMTDDDIRHGRLIANVSLALFHPAEFVELSLVLNTAESQAAANAAPMNRSPFP